MSSRRRLTDEEHALWKGNHSLGRRIAAQPAKEAPRREPSMRRPRETPKPQRPANPMSAVAPVKAAAPPAPATALDRRLKQRIARGTHTIDARLDLHGLSQTQAHDALRRFLRSSQAKGARIVLVITGKGAAARDDRDGERGVLKRQVPLWLRQAEFRGAVIGFETAGAAHGGEGALYLRLRKARQ